MRRTVAPIAIAALALGIALTPRYIISGPATDFIHFESGHVRPASLTPNGNRLLVVNTPNCRLAIFDVTGPRPVKVGFRGSRCQTHDLTDFTVEESVHVM